MRVDRGDCATAPAEGRDETEVECDGATIEDDVGEETETGAGEVCLMEIEEDDVEPNAVDANMGEV